jgi:hypothetical protein
VVDAVMGEEEDHHLASVDVHNPQGAVGRHNQVQVEVVDRGWHHLWWWWTLSRSLEWGWPPSRNGAEASDQDLAGKLGGGWLDLGDPWDLARLALDRSSRQL